MRLVITYTLARLLVFAATFAVLWLTPLRNAPFFLLLAAVLLSGLVSYVLLSDRRDAMSAVVAGRLGAGRNGEPAGGSTEPRSKEDG